MNMRMYRMHERAQELREEAARAADQAFVLEMQAQAERDRAARCLRESQELCRQVDALMSGQDLGNWGPASSSSSGQQ